MVKAASAFVMYGMGGASLDLAGGEATIVAEIKKLGVNIEGSPYQYYDTQVITDAIMKLPKETIVIIGGDSLGGNDGPLIAAALKTANRKVDYLFGFQPSVWGEHTVVTSNVVKAVCIYNPVWLETFGLGDYPWPLDEGNTTTELKLIEAEDAHPGDNDVAMQNIIFSDIKALIGD